VIFDQASSQTKKSGSKKLSGDDAFKLHDTYGFPFDLTLEMASEQGLSVDADGFSRLMKEQRERAKADAKAKKSGHTDLSEYRKIAELSRKFEFIGYSHIESESNLVGMVRDGKVVHDAQVGDEVELIIGLLFMPKVAANWPTGELFVGLMALYSRSTMFNPQSQDS